MTASKLRAMKSLGRVTISAVSRQLAGWAFTSVYLPGVIAACTVMSPERRATAGPSMVRAWGRTMSRIGRVEVRFTPRARAALSRREPRVLSFNHSSTLDVLTGAMVLPPGGVLVVKKEMRKREFYEKPSDMRRRDRRRAEMRARRANQEPTLELT